MEFKKCPCCSSKSNSQWDEPSFECGTRVNNGGCVKQSQNCEQRAVWIAEGLDPDKQVVKKDKKIKMNGTGSESMIAAVEAYQNRTWELQWPTPEPVGERPNPVIEFASSQYIFDGFARLAPEHPPTVPVAETTWIGGTFRERMGAVARGDELFNTPARQVPRLAQAWADWCASLHGIRPEVLRQAFCDYAQVIEGLMPESAEFAVSHDAADWLWRRRNDAFARYSYGARYNELAPEEPPIGARQCVTYEGPAPTFTAADAEGLLQQDLRMVRRSIVDDVARRIMDAPIGNVIAVGTTLGATGEPTTGPSQWAASPPRSSETTEGPSTPD